MKLAYRELIRKAIARGLCVSVHDGEEWSTRKSVQINIICKDIKGVEEASLRFRDIATNTVVGFALVSAYGLEPDETVIDCSAAGIISDIMDEVMEECDATL